jgi:hypothetical protein
VDITRAADYWLLRVAPVALRHVVLNDRGVGPIGRLARYTEQVTSGDITPLISYHQFEKLLADEQLRPSGGQYVLAHFYPPHEPYILDRNGNYVGESSYEEQLHLATNMMLEFVQILKEQGKFDNSLIIFQSDHGYTLAVNDYYAGEPLGDFIQIDKATSKAIGDVDVRHVSGALLLIKPPGVGGETGDLIVNDNLTQLLDLRQYINNVLDGGSLAYPERKEVSIQHGLGFQDRDGERIQVGRDIMSGYINHYIIRPGDDWEICDNLPFEYS